MNHNQDLVSIIMPSFNSERFMKNAIESIISQTYNSWELLIVDDCSSDRSYQIASSFAAIDSRINVCRLKENGGSAIARNTGIELAKGRYIAFLDSDDVWFPDKLLVQLEFMRQNQYAFTYSNYEIIDADSQHIGNKISKTTTNYHESLKGNTIGCLTAIYDTHICGKVDMPLIRMRQDFGLWLKILKKIDRAHNCNEVLAQYRVYNNSLTANKFKAARYTWRLFRDIEKLPLIYRIYVFAFYAINGVLGKILR